MSTLFRSRGDYGKAEQLSRQSLAIFKQAVGDSHPKYAGALANLAALERARGHYADADALYRQVLAIYAKTLGPAHPTYAGALYDQALAHIDARDPAQGVPVAAEALRTSRRLLELTAAAQSERQQLAMTDKLHKYLDGYLSVTARAGTSADAVYPEVLAWKGLVSARQRLIRRPGREDPEVVRLHDDLDHAARALATLSRAVYDPAKKDERLQNLEKQSDDVERLQRQLAARSAEFRRDFSPRQRTPDDIRKVLPPGAALVDFLEYRSYVPPPPGRDKESWQRRLVAFIVTREGSVRRFELGPTAPVADAVDAWRKTVGASANPAHQPAADLRRLVWEPLADALKGAHTVLVSPDGALDRFPFAALPGREPGSYLIEDVAVAVVPLPRLLPELLAAGPAWAGDPTLLVVGEVAFDGAAPAGEALASAGARAAPRGSGTALKWAPLPGTRAEVLAIRDSFERRFRRGHVTMLREEEPTEEEVRREAPRHRYLHFATHGFFAPPQIRSALAEASGGPEGSCSCSMFRRKDVAGFHPALLSGLVLAGANLPVRADKDDGVLTALEVQELDLAGVELATLSACETGLGQTAGGEGLLGLQRAFQVAGAHSVVASLWQVHDEASRALMTDFYENLWRRKLSKLEALRQAQLTMLREGIRRGLELADHPPDPQRRLPPYYWAAFVLSGDWR